MNPNPSAQELLGVLQGQHQALFRKMGSTTDPRMGQAILQEAGEILHRMNLIQNLVLIEVAERVTAAVAEVKAADKKLTAELASFDKVERLVQAMSSFLEAVDKALDLMKTIPRFLV